MLLGLLRKIFKQVGKAKHIKHVNTSLLKRKHAHNHRLKNLFSDAKNNYIIKTE